MLRLEEGISQSLRRRHGIELRWRSAAAERPDHLAAAVAAWWMNEGAINSLPRVAAEELHGGGVRSPVRTSLAALHGNESDATEDDLRHLVGELMAELGYPNSYAGGVALFCGLHIDRVARSLVHPYLGAACLQWARLHAPAAPDNAIEVFSSLAQRWLIRPDDRGRTEGAIAGEARSRLEHFPRLGIRGSSARPS